MDTVTIRIDPEFKSLIPPLTDEEYDGLRDSLLNEGCRDAIVVWDGILVDGHNRYEICEKHGIPYDVVEMEFASRNDAKLWIYKNQLSRRNLRDLQRIEIVRKLEDVVREKAKQRQSLYYGNQYESGLQENFPDVQNVQSRDELGKMAGVSGKTYEKGVAVLENAPAPVVEATRRDELSIDMAHKVTKLEPEEQEEIAIRLENIENETEETNTPKAVIQEVLKRPHVSFNSGNNEWYTPAEFIEAAREAMGNIDVDPASNDIAQEVVKAGTYYTAETNGLDKTWTGNVWMNPPYASELIGKFIDKLVTERQNYKQAIVLVNNATETEWFNKIISIATVVCFPKSRVKFYMPDGKTGAPLQGQAVIYIGENKQNFINAFSNLGWCAVIYGI